MCVLTEKHTALMKHSFMFPVVFIVCCLSYGFCLVYCRDEEEVLVGFLTPLGIGDMYKVCLKESGESCQTGKFNNGYPDRGECEDGELRT